MQNAVDIANETMADPVIVVLGSNVAQLEKEIDDRKVHIAENKDWQEGLASSIRSGLETLQHIAPTADGVILMVCDQPHISPDLLNELIAVQCKTEKTIIASQYKDTVGTPAIFHRSLFAELLELKGEAGAKKIMENHPVNLGTVRFEKGSIDIDTEKDYEALLKG